MILCDQEQLSPGSSSFDVRSNVTCGAKKVGLFNSNEKDENNEQFSHENSCKGKVKGRGPGINSSQSKNVGKIQLSMQLSHLSIIFENIWF